MAKAPDIRYIYKEVVTIISANHKHEVFWKPSFYQQKQPQWSPRVTSHAQVCVVTRTKSGTKARQDEFQLLIRWKST